MKLVETVLIFAIFFTVLLVVRADIENTGLLQSLIEAAVWLSDNIANYSKPALEAIIIPFKPFWQLVLDNADQIAEVWANEVMPDAASAEAAAAEMAAFLKDELGPLLEPLA